ncbi:hypothetical protein HanIR_Chr15g0753541 [Helianthus annuus]|nr:hypothetical protein HanIR_Chr15g0753541 [Helianthus annuus]
MVVVVVVVVVNHILTHGDSRHEPLCGFVTINDFFVTQLRLKAESLMKCDWIIVLCIYFINFKVHPNRLGYSITNSS